VCSVALHDSTELGIAVDVAIRLAPLARSNQPGEYHDAEVRLPPTIIARWCL
jgi:hypothetical protein